ncbi:MAG TPA: ABC transporter substrate-binding protein [Jatrophihabitantaceae bacterium]|jgi:peptide/nickel transport system substrate-binding protein
MKLVASVAALCALATVLSACSGSSNNSNKPKSTGSGSNSGTSSSKVVSNGTFTLASSSDPGNLDPQGSALTVDYQMAQFAYDSLLSIDAKGTIGSGLATSWQVSGKNVSLTMHKNVTCSDGAPFTAADAAANINYVADPKNKSPWLGVFIPAGAKATGDAAVGTLRITLAGAAPFVLNGLASLPMVCAKGMQNRKSLARSTDGTGPYQLTEVVASDHYTYTKRTGYTWGPAGASTATAGIPAKIVVKVVQNETTAANLLLSGGLSAATIVGADVKRLKAAHLFEADVNVVAGEMWFNQAAGKPGADPAVRQALTTALDLAQVQKVITSGNGAPPTEFAALPPVACPGNSVSAALPAHSLDKAKQELDAAGWKAGAGGIRTKNGKQLAVTFVWANTGGAGVSAAAELATQTWQQLGVKVSSKGQDATTINATLFSTGNWDVGWLTLNVSSPDQLVPFLSGPVPASGTNFGHINNSAYTALVAKASAQNGAAGCPDWLKAETEIVRAADVIPFANQVTTTFGNHTQFAIAGAIVPTSIRMLAS